MKMPSVSKCEMEMCAYNMDMTCHAMAITIGGHGCPECDTMVKDSNKAGEEDVVAGVGACKVADCAHNEKLECVANDISVGQFGDQAACQTYSKRS